MKKILMLVVVLTAVGSAVARGPSDAFTPTIVENEEPQSTIRLSGYLLERAKRGDAFAQHTFGLAYATGDNVNANGQTAPRDYAEAVRWFRLAAEQGYMPAQYNLGIMYEKGDSVPVDRVEAYMWLNLAAVQGHTLAEENKSRIEKSMTHEQIAEGQRMSREWIASHPPE